MYITDNASGTNDNCTDRGANEAVAKLPFSKHHIDPVHIEAMRSAFQKVCDVLQLKCEVGDPMTEIIVNKIVAAANGGEHDPDRLTGLVLADLVRNGS
jgi:hypothetical protein